jgi:hypothetical protein
MAHWRDDDRLPQTWLKSCSAAHALEETMQGLNGGIGDLKNFNPKNREAPAGKFADPQARCRKLWALVALLLLTWGALHIVLSAILTSAPSR